ncbi:MAG: hypothetical protein H6721_27525 [Sandaracinus sp.]|nr:hypothetical protein [Sandaracinus sp.]MCB9635886.1 hypothetical protein [Sandaracinus sp.]
MVDTDLDVPATIDRFVIDVTSPSGTTQSATAMLGDGEPVPPRTLGLVPENDVLGPYEVVARGLLGDVEVVARQARFDFVPKATVVLTMHLVQSCVGRDCGGQTCSENGCEAVLRTDFGAWTGTPPRLGEQPPPFDGGVDSGVDAGAEDTGVADTGADACVAEVCNEADDDCDGRVDEDVTAGDEVCNGIDDDCDGNVDEGFDLTSDLNNCGTCGRQCVFRNGEGICNAGNCTITSCTAPFDDCDRDGSTGCETDTNASASNCGACGNVCRNPNRACCSGTCQRSC